jgi:hypothetical protein
MKPETRRNVQIALAVALVLATARLALIYYGRHAGEAAQRQAQPAPPLDADYYVTPRKLHLYDVQQARQELTKQPVWVRDGNYHTYFPYDPAQRRVDFQHEAGVLGPLEKLAIRDVIRAKPAGRDAVPQVVAVFSKDGKQYGFSIGAIQHGDAAIYADDILFYQDPHQLYRHWPADVWQAIDQHQVKPGMNELQVSFALGTGRPNASGDSAVKTVVYPNAGHEVIVTYRDGKAAEIRQST